MQHESLEPRTLLTSYTYPYGAMPDDTGEYMLGDVAVNVVLMESDPSLYPYDNNSPSDLTNPGRGSPVENWDASSIAAAKTNVEAGLQWWKDTLANMFRSAPPNLLNFHINYQYADNPVHTGYEPIDRFSDDFQYWMYSFLDLVHFDTTGNFSSDIRAYNDYTRQQANADWAFTIFVVNNANDSDKLFAPGGSFSQAFSFAGGRFMVVPASRPPATFAHETGHQFWALDEYLGGGSYTSQRGYYNTQNLNAADNPAPGFVQADSIMSNGTKMTNSYADHTLDQYTMAAIGWQDSDQDGIFDVLDVPFSLSGSGQYNASTGIYSFDGSSQVNTLPNRNSSGLQDDITINQINVLQASIDGGLWQTVQTFPARTYQANMTIGIPVPSTGIHDIDLRTADLRTGVISNIFHGETDAPTSSGSGVGGMIFDDLNANGAWDSGEPPSPDTTVEVLDETDTPLSLMHAVEPSSSDFSEGQVLNTVEPGGTLSAFGSDVNGNSVVAKTSQRAPSAGRVFASNSFVSGGASELWNNARKLRVDFDSPASTVSLRAYGGDGAGFSYGRLEAYNSANQLVARFTTGALTAGGFTTMSVSRAEGDIDHVIASGRLGTNVVLDTLQWGPGASSTSNSFGAYSLGYLPDGTYHLRVEATAGHYISTPFGGTAVVTVSGGQTGGSVNFGIAPISGFHYPFHNVNHPNNVNNDSRNIITALDALMVINFLNSNVGGEGEIGSGFNPATIGYVDVNNDGKCTAFDALSVIAFLNANGAGAAGEGEPASAPTSAPANAAPAGGGEGEGQVPVPQNAADYFAQQPLHLLNIQGTDQPCTCAACMAARGAAIGAVVQSPADVAKPLGSGSDGGGLVSSFSPAESGTRTSLTSISSSAMLSTSSPLVKGHSRTSYAIIARKEATSSLTRLAPKIEETLDDIAADISHSSVADIGTQRDS